MMLTMSHRLPQERVLANGTATPGSPWMYMSGEEGLDHQVEASSVCICVIRAVSWHLLREFSHLRAFVCGDVIDSGSI